MPWPQSGASTPLPRQGRPRDRSRIPPPPSPSILAKGSPRSFPPPSPFSATFPPSFLPSFSLFASAARMMHSSCHESHTRPIGCHSLRAVFPDGARGLDDLCFEGRDYVSLEDIAAFYGFPSRRRSAKPQKRRPPRPRPRPRRHLPRAPPWPRNLASLSGTSPIPPRNPLRPFRNHAVGSHAGITGGENQWREAMARLSGSSGRKQNPRSPAWT